MQNMKELKDIDRLFQEKFKDFEAQPPAEVWNNIAEKLDADKTKRRIIPWWYWTSGVAALFIVGFLGFNFFTNSTTSTGIDHQSPVVNTTEAEQNTNKIDRLDGAASDTQKAVTSSPTNDASDTPQQTSASPLKETIQTPRSSTPKSTQINRYQQKSTAIAKRSNHSKSSKSTQKLENNQIVEERIADAHLHNKWNYLKDVDAILAENITKQSSTLENNKVRDANNIVNDDTPIAEAAEMNELEKLLQDKQNTKEVTQSIEKPEQRWSLHTVIAPVGFGTTGTGSILDPSLAANDKTYEMSVSYGVGMQYKVDKNLSIRTGVHRVTLGYNTNDLDFMPNMSARRLQNVNHTPQGSTISVQTKGGVTSLVENPVSMPNGGFLNQRMGFVEVPTEVSYRLFGSKMGVTLIGGFSSLFLTENRIEAIAHSFQTNLGEANNINSVSFSSNIGVGLEYAFFKNFQAHVEPMFKYQFNTFRGDVGNVRPYFFGVYSGVSYTF